MKVNTVRTGLILTATMLLASSLLGCGVKNNTHAENVAKSDTRLRQIRSAVMYDTARTQFVTGQLDMCQRTLEESLRQDPTSAKLLTLYGQLKIERGQLERAYHFFQAAIEADEAYPEPRYFQGIVLQRWQRHDAAYERYKEAFELEADNAGYLLAMAEMLVAMNDTGQAIDLLEGKVIYFDQNAGVRGTLGYLYSINGDYARATEMFRQASQLEPDNLKVREDLALTQTANGDDRAAVTTYRQLLEQPEAKDRSDLKRLLAAALIRTGNQREARDLYFDLTRLPDADVDDWVRYGELSWKLDDEGNALNAANRAMRIAPQRHEGYVLAGLIWQKRDRLDDALLMYDRAASVAPESASPLILRGIALQKAGRLEAAADAYTEALKRQPTDARALRLLRSVADAMN